MAAAAFRRMPRALFEYQRDQSSALLLGNKKKLIGSFGGAGFSSDLPLYLISRTALIGYRIVGHCCDGIRLIAAGVPFCGPG